MPEIPAVYGEWESPCCGDPGDCNEACGQRPYPQLVRVDGEPVDARAQRLVESWWDNGGEGQVTAELLRRSHDAIFGRSRVDYPPFRVR